MIALVDCNNFYASCERVFNPAIKNLPVVVLSNNDGCVIARSNEAKDVGVPMGAPLHQIQDFITNHNVQVFSSNYALYGDLSNRVMKTLQEFVPETEVYSIDEAFLDLSSMNNFDLNEFALLMRNTVLKNVGIPVSVGMAPTKSLAKIANKLAKKNNYVCVLDTPTKITEALKNTSIQSVWGVGRAHGKLLIANNINTAFDFMNTSVHWVQKKMGVVGVRLQKELKGVQCISFDLVQPAKKAICTSRSFGEKLKDIQAITEAVATFTARCAEKLRQQHSCASIIHVSLHTNNFNKSQPQYHPFKVVVLPAPTNNTMELITYTNTALQDIFKSGYLYKKAGVVVSGIVPDTNLQQDLFSDVSNNLNTELLTTVDNINKSFGKDKIRVAKQGFNKKWLLKSEKKSNSFSTKWDELITIIS